MVYKNFSSFFSFIIPWHTIVCKSFQSIIIIFFKFQDNPAVLEELDLVEEEDQFTHTVPLIDEEKKLSGEEILNVFKFDPDYEQSENKYQDIKKSLLGDSDSDGDDSDDKGKN